jgi:hypothetical protein
VDNGYDPVPLYYGQKNPCAGKDWPHYKFSAADVERWPRAGVGLLCGKIAPIDIDILEATLSHQCEELAVSTFGPGPRRVGQPPKVLLPMRAEAPFTKLLTRSYRLPGDRPEDKPHRVEIPALGQQVVSYNIHPDTRRPYQWNGAGEPLTVPIDQLPVISEARAREYIAACDQLLAEFPGARVVSKLVEQDAGRPHAPNEKLRAANPQECREALAAIPNDDFDYESWGTIMLATKAALGDDGEDAFMAWSAQSKKDVPKVTKYQYRRARPRTVGAGLIYHLAQQHGWRRRGGRT